MTKSAEIDLLQGFIDRLPKDSYLWPWLVQVHAEVVADIRDDVVIAPTIARAREEYDQIVAGARTAAERILATAQTDAAAILDRTKAEAATLAETRRKWTDTVVDALHQFRTQLLNA